MKKYFIQTFGCAMNSADSEKINMLLLQSGFLKVTDHAEADLIILNTCSVRKKGEDRVFSIVKDIIKERKRLIKEKVLSKGSIPIFGITGCMVRKTGVNSKYLSEKKERDRAKKIELLQDEKGIFNNDDKLFPRLEALDFTLRIEEIKYLLFILSHIFGEKIGQDDKFDDYLKMKQLRDNPALASIVVQTGCDNFCTYCIVPYTRGKEFSRNPSDIIADCKESIKNGAKEITLLGQNVNSYGKQFIDSKLWNSEKCKWNLGYYNKKLNIGIDLDDSLIQVWYDEIFENYNRKHNKNLKFSDMFSHNFNGDENLKNEFYKYRYDNFERLYLYNGASDVLKKLKNDGHKLFVITSREDKEKKLTFDLLEKEFGKNFFEKIIFTCDYNEDKKGVFANLNSLDLVIEDAPHHIENYINNSNCKVFVFNQPWNKNLKEKDNLYLMNSWDEIYKKINLVYNFKSPFRTLLEDIDSLDGINRIRFTSSNPHDMTQDILDSHFELKHMCNYLHFALQSGNDQILKKMNRKHTYADFKKQVEYLRSKDPLFSISTDLIVGFSGETEEAFQDTLKTFEECQFDFAYIARYSVRPGTIAAKMYPDDVPDYIKAERWHLLNNALMRSLTQRNLLMIGREEEVIIYGETPNQFFGRTKNFKEVYFDKDKKYQIGDLVKVKIIEIDKWVLKGKIIN